MISDGVHQTSVDLKLTVIYSKSQMDYIERMMINNLI